MAEMHSKVFRRPDALARPFRPIASYEAGTLMAADCGRKPVECDRSYPVCMTAIISF
jgi:hypothetical protein